MSTIEPLIAKAAAELESRDANWEEFSVVWGISPKGKGNDSWGYWSDPEPPYLRRSLSARGILLRIPSCRSSLGFASRVTGSRTPTACSPNKPTRQL